MSIFYHSSTLNLTNFNLNVLTSTYQNLKNCYYSLKLLYQSNNDAVLYISLAIKMKAIFIQVLLHFWFCDVTKENINREKIL